MPPNTPADPRRSAAAKIRLRRGGHSYYTGFGGCLPIVLSLFAGNVCAASPPAPEPAGAKIRPGIHAGPTPRRLLRGQAVGGGTRAIPQGRERLRGPPPQPLNLHELPGCGGELLEYLYF